MNRSPALIGLPKETPTPQTSGRFPGIALRRFNVLKFRTEITFIKGTVIQVSPAGRQQSVLAKAKQLGFFYNSNLVTLIGDSYLYWCGECKQSIIAWQVPPFALVRAQLMERRVPNAFDEALKPHCPYCMGILDDIKQGDKVLLHYRYSEDGIPKPGTPGKWITPPSWATWFAERRDW